MNDCRIYVNTNFGFAKVDRFAPRCGCFDENPTLTMIYFHDMRRASKGGARLFVNECPRCGATWTTVDK